MGVCERVRVRVRHRRHCSRARTGGASAPENTLEMPPLVVRLPQLLYTRVHAHQHQLRNLSVRWEINDVTRDGGRLAGGRAGARALRAGGRACITVESK